MPTKPPNFLVLMADQMTPFALSAYGHHVTKTPNMDALAARGVVFDSAYCASPLCAPSRFSFLSGKLPSAIGAYDNAAEFPSQTLTFAHYLRAELLSGIDGTLSVRPFADQDSSLVSVFAHADALLHRPAGAPAARGPVRAGGSSGPAHGAPARRSRPRCRRRRSPRPACLPR